MSQGIIDFHSHLFPGVDDGAQDLEQALRGLSSFAAEGVSTVITTPHFDASLTQIPDAFSSRMNRLDNAWNTAAPAFASRFPDITVHRGVELMLDIPDPVLSDPRLALAGGRFMLVEFPMFVPPNSARVLEGIVAAGFKPIVAHPERYEATSGNMDLAGAWRSAGAFLQVNGGSLLGRYGSTAREIAFEILAAGMADYLCSDFHSRGDPGVRRYVDVLRQNDAEEQAVLLTQTNPSRILLGSEPLPVSPVVQSGRFKRGLRRLFGR